jgi:hypothetical protein
MSTRIRIERLVLDGIELSRRERDALGPAIARELRRLAGEPAHELAGEQADPRGEPRRRGASPAVDGIAREVAAGVHRVMPAAQPALGVTRGGRR